MKQDPIHQATIALMDSLTDQTEWTEKRIALHDATGKFVTVLPSNTHYGAVASLCRRFNLTDSVVEVKVTYNEN